MQALEARAARRTHQRRIAGLCLLAACAAVIASPEKAARFYEDALQHYEKGDLPGTVIQLKNTLQEDRKMLAAHLLLGKVLLKNGELKAAEAALEEALRQGVSRAEVAVPLGQVYLGLGDSKKLLDQVVTTGLPATMHAEILTLRGLAYSMSANLTLATQSFAEARAADPKSALPLVAEAPLLLRQGEREKARAAATRATELAPENAGAWYVLGTILQANADIAAAMVAYEKALSISPKLVDARVARASLLIGLNRDPEADQEMVQLRAWNVVDPRAAFLQATLAARRGDVQTAKAQYATAAGLIDAVPQGVRSNNEALLMSGALSHRSLGNLEKAREYLEALLARNSRHFSAQLLLTSILVDSKEYGRAIPILESLRAASPDDAQVAFLLGSVYLARKQYAQAAEFFEKSARRNPSPDAVRELGMSQLALGQDKAALANLEKAFAGNPKDPRASTELAVTYAKLGLAAKALQTAQAIVKSDPDNLAMLNFLGNTRGLVGDIKGARETYEKVLAKDAAFRPSSINLSWMDIDAGRFDAARARLQKLLQARQDDAAVLFQLGVLESKAKRPQAAIEAWSKANEVQRSDPRAGLALMDLLASQRQHEQALALGKSMVAKFPESVGMQLALSRAHFAVGDAVRGRQSLTDATRLAAFDPGLQVMIGRIQLQYGNPEDASYNAAKALQSRPDDREAMVLMVEIEARRGNAAGVNNTLKALVAKHPDAPATLLTTAAVAMSRGQFPAAISGFRAALDKEPTTSTAIMLGQALIANAEADKAQAFLDGWSRKRPSDALALKALSEVQLHVGNTVGARQSYAQIIAMDPDDPAVLASYAVLLQRLGDPGATAAAEKAFKLAPSNPQYADTYGWILVQQGNLEPGVRVLREARLRDPANGQLRYHLAFALTKAGKRMEAKEELGAVLSGVAKAAITPDVIKLKAELGL